MNRILFFMLLLSPITVKSQVYCDSLVCKGGKYLFIKIDSAYYSYVEVKNKNNIVLYTYMDQINESDHIKKYTSKVFRKGNNLVLITANADSVKISNKPSGGDGAEYYKFVDYNKNINFYIVLLTGNEYYKLILVSANNGKQYAIPANVKILINTKQIIASNIDYVNGGSWLEAYNIKDNKLTSFYKLSDFQDKWFFTDSYLDFDKKLVVKCQNSFTPSSFKYYKIIKK